MTTEQPISSPAPSRRQVLCGLAVALLAPGALAAACGGSDGGSGSGAGAGTAGAGPATTGAAGATTAGGGGSSSNALAKLSDVPVGGGIIVDGGPSGKVLLVQPTAGTVKAYDPTCTHQATAVNPPQGGVITCPAHGSQFNAADGSVKSGPAPNPLAAVDVRVDGDSVVLA